MDGRDIFIIIWGIITSIGCLTAISIMIWGTINLFI